MRALRVLVPAAALLILVLLAVWWSGRDVRPPTTPPGHPADAAAPGTATGAGDDAGPAVAADPDAAGVAGAAASGRVALETDPDAPVCTIEGQLLADPALPIHGAEIVAYRGRPGESANLASLMSLAQRGREPQASDLPFVLTGSALGRVKVQDDGTFVLAVRERHLRLRLEHDFYGLHVPEIVHVETATDRAHVILEPYLGGCLRGRVLGPNAAAVRGVQVVPEPDPMLAARDPNAFLGTIVAAAEHRDLPVVGGAFTARAVSPGAMLRLIARGSGVGGSASQPPLRPGELREIVLAVQATHELNVHVIDSSGRPIADAGVNAHPRDRAASMTGQIADQRSARTDAAGNATITGLLPGSYSVRGGHRGYVSASGDAAVPAETRLELRLSRGGSVRGVVVDGDGAPIAAAHVGTVESMDVPLLGDMTSQLGLDLLGRIAEDGEETDAEGRFEVSGIAGDAPFHVVASHPDFAPGICRDVTAGADDVRVVLHPGAGLRLRVLADEARGDVPLTDYTAKLMARMFLVVERPVHEERVAAAADGRGLLQGVTPGSYTLVVTAEGRGEASQSVTLTAGETVDVGDVRLPRAASIHGRVVDPEGQPIAGASVQQSRGGMMDNPALAMLQGPGLQARTDKNGDFTLNGMAPGRIYLAANADGFAPGRSDRLELGAGQQLMGVLITLGHGGRIRGVLHTAVGDRVEDFTVLAQNEVTKVQTPGTITADGAFAFDNLPPGRYLVQAMHPAAMQAIQGAQTQGAMQPGRRVDFGQMMSQITEHTVQQRCTVQDGQTTEVELDASELGGGLTATLRVAIGGEPLRNAVVEATMVADGRVRTGFADGAGRVELKGLAAGALRVQVRAGMALTPVGAPTTIELPGGTDRFEATIELPGAELSGRVVDRDSGEPLSAVLVRLLRDDDDHDDTLGTAITDGDGAFTFRALLPGSYGLVAADALVQRSAVGAASRADGIRVGDGERRSGIVLRAGPAVGARVTVTDDQQSPVAGAMLLAVDDEGRALGDFAIAVSGQDGVAHLGGLPRGRVRFVGRAPGLAPGATETFDCQPGQSLDAALHLERGTAVVLQTVGRDGRPLLGAQVTARCDGGPWFPASLLLELRTADGRLELGRLGAGDWEFRVEHPASGAFTVRHAIAAGPAVTIVANPPR